MSSGESLNTWRDQLARGRPVIFKVVHGYHPLERILDIPKDSWSPVCGVYIRNICLPDYPSTLELLRLYKGTIASFHHGHVHLDPTKYFLSMVYEGKIQLTRENSRHLVLTLGIFASVILEKCSGHELQALAGRWRSDAVDIAMSDYNAGSFHVGATPPAAVAFCWVMRPYLDHFWQIGKPSVVLYGSQEAAESVVFWGRRAIKALLPRLHAGLHDNYLPVRRVMAPLQYGSRRPGSSIPMEEASVPADRHVVFLAETSFGRVLAGYLVGYHQTIRTTIAVSETAIVRPT
ncbi:hypothetical protein QBC35DRAFT_446685 [Podospora australis]|uniref:Uncharacterized protein n=1 Tax=Podospora australis TaxID=1536484 RepID=A0AAN6X4M0_9PEZI|nr:hypothetical protein QBC35DRAFT_446685 [Podospora australis]